MHTHPRTVNRTRLLARLVRELLAERSYDSWCDLVDDLKQRCSRLRIAWSNDDITDALRLVASNVSLPRAAAVEAQRRRLAGRAAPEAPQQIGRAEAAAILHRLGIRV